MKIKIKGLKRKDIDRAMRSEPLIRKLNKMGRNDIVIGFSDMPHPDAEGFTFESLYLLLSDPQLARYVPTVPRPLLQNAWDYLGEDWKRDYVRILNRHLNRGYKRFKPSAVWEEFGELIVQDIKNGWESFAEPDNKASTIKQKGGSTPLVDTGKLRDDLDWKVV